MTTLVIYAPNVGGGGGLVLLRALLAASWPAFRVIAILDRRGQAHLDQLPPGMDVRWVDSNIGGRWRAERLLADLAGRGDTILCFHNLPPMRATQARVFCYVQNAYLVGVIPVSGLRGWLRVRIGAERLIARLFRHRIHQYVVQTPTMAVALRKWYGSGAPPIEVLPFSETERPPVTSGSDTPTPQWDFLYVSDGLLHKNHRRLFAAWRLLAEQGIRPSLAVTLHPERDSDLRLMVGELAASGLRIDDLGHIPHTEVQAAYRVSRALIFPSYAESFGLPLLEAQQANLPILAPELDYVRDVCDPTATFDAFSPRSIARAVSRFLDRPADRVQPMTAADFATAFSDLAANGKS